MRRSFHFLRTWRVLWKRRETFPVKPTLGDFPLTHRPKSLPARGCSFVCSWSHAPPKFMDTVPILQSDSGSLFNSIISLPRDGGTLSPGGSSRANDSPLPRPFLRAVSSPFFPPPMQYQGLFPRVIEPPSAAMSFCPP